jgi:hypothetical protein
MFKNPLRLLGMFGIGLAAGIAGLLVGALFGGNFATEFTFIGLRGYEATGQVGLLLGAALGLYAGWRLLFPQKKA